MVRRTGVGVVTDEVIHYLEGQHETILERLKAVLRLPSISTDPAYAEGMAATRAHFLQRLQEMGLDNVQLLDGGGHPALYGAWTAHRPSSSTGTTTCSHPTRLNCGIRRRSTPPFATVASMRVALPM